MAAVRIPRRLTEAVRQDPDPGRREWLSRLPDTIAELTERWTLRVGEPYEPGGQCSWTAPVVDATGRPLVLKVGWWHPEAAHEADGLRLWDGDGTVRLYASHQLDLTSALLLERCVPGTPLTQTLPEPDQDGVVANLLRRLWREPPSGHPFRNLASMCAQWADSFEERFAAAPGALDPGMARAGIALYRELPTAADRQVLLCTDLHADNIVAAERESWLVIDPKPYVGDPTYDATQHMLNCPDRLVADPVGFVRTMAGLLDLDAKRLMQWLFARCVQESLSPDMPRAYEIATCLATQV